MKRETSLDYAEFLLTQTCTRCELYISADGVKEKLASGYFKPFVTHLRAAELQMARDSQIIRLERPPDLSKKNNNTWFTKGTLERFVRFVSTPEVLELVKNIEDELSQLEQVRIALSKTFSQQSEVQFPTIDTTFSPTGAYPERGGMSMMPRRLSMDADDNGAETSKRELLRAMDVRLIALKQEQNLAFSRATAAGFDSSNMADLMDFSEHFGAERLRDACLQFIGLSRKRNIPQEVDEEIDSPYADAASTGSDMSLGSGTDFELAAETFPSSVRSSEAWLNAQNVSAFDAGKKLGDLKSGSQEKTNVSMDGTSVRTRSRWGPPERIQINCLDPEVCSLQDSEISGKVPEINDQVAHHNCQDGIRLRESGMRTFRAEEGRHSIAHFEEHSTFTKQSPIVPTDSTPSLFKEHSTFTKQSPIVPTDSTPSLFKGQKQQGDKKGETVWEGGMFFTRLQKMAQQVEARRSGEDLGVHFTSVGMSDETPAPQVSALGKSSMLLESVWNPLESSHSYTVQDFGDEGVAQPQSQDSKMVPRPPSPGKNFPISPERLQVGSSHSQSSNSVVIPAADHSYPVDRLNREKDKAEKPAEMHATETESSKSRDNQEEPISTSARRLSVQAAISLFESKKPNVGEASSKKLVRQESQKGATQSGGSSTSEKAVLRRWSGIGIASPRDSSTHDKAPDLDTKEPRKNVEMEYATEKDDSTSRNSNVMIDKQAQSAADKNSTQASKLFRNTFPHLTSAQQSGPEADALSSKIRPFVQQQPLAVESSTWPGGDLQKQFKLELEKSLTRNGQNSIQVDAILPSKSVADASKTSDFVAKKLPKDPTSEIKGKGQPTVNSMVLDIKGRLGPEEKRNWTEQNMKPLPGKLALSGPTVPSLSNFKEDKADHSMPASLKQDFRSAKESNIVKLINETDRNSQTESKLSSGRFSGDTQQDLGEEPSSIFYDISVDLYMQALVMMIDNNHQSSLNFGDEESLIEQRGRFYEHYRRVRNARQRGEHPAKRAEREAKLNSMKETLERRKAEMEAGALRPSKKNSQLVKEQIRLGKLQAQKPGLMITQKEQEELGEEEEGIDQEDQLLYVTSPASKNHVSTLKAQAAKKSAPTLQKCPTAPRTSMQTASASSPRAILKNPTGTSSQRKLAIPSYNGTDDNSINRSVPSLVEFRKEVSKSSSGRSVATSRVSAKVNGHSRTVSDAAALAESGNMEAVDDALSEIADEEMKGQSSLRSKSRTSPSEVKTSSAQALDQIVLESFKGHENVGADSVVNGKSCSVVQEVKSFLLKAQGFGPGSGPGVTEQKFSTIVDTLKSFDEQVLSDSIVCEEETDPDSLGRADLEVEDLRKSFVPDELDCFAEHAVSMTSILPNNYSLNDEGSPSVNKGQLDGLDVEATGYVLVDASGDGKVLSTDEVDEGKHQRNFSGDTISVAHNSFTGSANHEKRHGVVTLAEKTTELSQSDSNSSAYLRAASLPPECTTSTHSNAAASPANSSERRPGTVPGPFSLRPAMLSDSPLGSPASWNSSQAKHFSEHDLIHSRKQFSGPQKPVPIMSQSIKEPAKGFKRLLHFGRKSRASEAASTDCISASTTSEGDDDTEEAKELVRQSSDDLFRRAKLQERGSDYGNNGDHYSFQDQGATHSLRSSIPAPPANFKLREDHLSGGTLLKAPRSFFSLSSFRSRGGEGKPR